MAYTKTTWVDETLAGAERFDVEDNVGTPIHQNVQIKLATGVTVAGTPIDAAKLNKIEQALEDAHADGFVTNAKIRDSAGRSVIGRAGATTGDVADITAISDTVLGRRGANDLAFGQVQSTQIQNGQVLTVNIGDLNVTQGKLAPGASKLTNRQGGSATNWRTKGITNYTPAAVRMQSGVIEIPISDLNYTGSVSVTFPVAFSNTPIVMVSVAIATGINPGVGLHVETPAGSASAVTIWVGRTANSGSALVEVNWLAIGPE